MLIFISSSTQVINIFPPPSQYPRITTESLSSQIGLVQEFFKNKLEAHNNDPLVEDLELPPKQRPTATRPRLPASGKIVPPPNLGGSTSSPSKRPAPPSASFGSKYGISEPNKKRIKKNSGAGMGIPEDENSGSIDSAKPDSNAKTNETNGEDDVAASTFGDIGNSKNGVDNSATSDGAGELDEQANKAGDGTVPLTNGTAGDAS